MSRDTTSPANQAPGGDVAIASRQAWLVFSAAGLFIFYQLALQSLPSVLRDGLVVDFSLTDAGFGGLSASFFQPYILLQVPSGFLVSRFGPRQLLIAGLVLCIVASFVTAWSQQLAFVTAARVVMGVGAAPSFVATMALVARWFPSHLFPVLIAVAETIGMLGAALGQETLGLVVETAGWRVGMLLCAWFGVVVLVLTVVLVWDAPHPQQRTAPAAPLGDLARMMLAPPLILVGLAGGMVYSAGLAFAMLWGVPFLEHRLAIDLATASFCASFYSWGIIIGLQAFGWACGRLAGPVPLLAAGMLLTGGSVASILYAPPSLMVASLGMLLCGFSNGSYALAFVVVKSQVSNDDAGAALAFANMLIVAIGGFVMQPLIGVLAAIQGRPITDPGPLGILIWAQVLGLILLVPLTRCIRTKRPT